LPVQATAAASAPGVRADLRLVHSPTSHRKIKPAATQRSLVLGLLRRSQCPAEREDGFAEFEDGVVAGRIVLKIGPVGIQGA
jgi:hypothetical protein